MSMECEFGIAFVGFCKKPAVASYNARLYCKDHISTKCNVCQGQATGECHQTIGSFVCGRPLCEKCHCSCISRQI